MDYCERKGVMCECLSDHSVCNSDNCHRKLPDKAEMTDNEIINGLRYCLQDNEDCFKCPLYNKDLCPNSITKAKAYLDLINRQKAEIERLSNFVSEERCYEIAREMIPQFVRQARAEAIKEFAERLKKKSQKRVSDHYGERIFIQDIENLVKEMTGDQNDG